MKNYLIILSISLWLSGCTAAEVENQQEQVEESGIKLTQEQIDYNNIQIGRLKMGPLYHTIKATGMVDVPPNLSLKLSSPIEAYVSKILVLPGDRVSKGQAIGELTHPAIAQAQQDYLATKARLQFVERDLKRKADLLESKAVSQRAYDEQLSDQENLLSRLRALEAELSRLGIDKGKMLSQNVSQSIPLRAPIGGVITELFTKTGEYVTASAPIVSILNREHEHVELQVFQGDLDKVYKGMPVWLRLPGKEQVYTGDVFLVNTRLDPETLSANVHVHPGEDFPHLPINAVAFGEVIYQVDTVFTLPKSEIIKEGAANFIFIKTADGFQKQEIQVGFNDGENVGILGPKELLQKEVVLKGNYYLNGV